MSDSLLAQFNLVPEQIPHLPAKVRNSLLTFLVRWEAHQDVLACLEHLDVARYVSFQDRQAQALLGLARAGEAVSVMEARLAQRESVPARMLLGRCHLAAGKDEAALDAVRPLVANDYGPAWSLRGDVHLARGDLDAAESAYLRHRQLAPSSRIPLLGLARLHHRRGDGVTAAAYAVQAYTVGEGERPLTLFELRELADLFADLGDANRLEATRAEVVRQRDEDVAAMVEALAAAGRGEAVSTAPRRERTVAPAQPVPTPPPLPDLESIPVDAGERAKLAEAARRVFAFETLRPGQAEIMACARRGENVLAILPTGAGKSLCYQLPALLDDASPGTTLVISPLIALMKDQIDNLPAAAREQAIAINSSMDGSELRAAVEAVAAGDYRLVYAAPERLRQPSFLHALRGANLARLVIDEAHCVSAWGHDFRPDYLYIAAAHKELGSPPILALTATAPLQVRRDIERQLFGADGAGDARMRVIALDSFRPNLRLVAFHAADKDAKLHRLIELCSSLEGSGIVYARTRRQCEELAALLREHGVDAVHYHAGISNRSGVQDRFMRGDVRVIVATIAFGMGVDKPDIRFIVHFGLPDSLEAYYQEAGRAGRDGKQAHCILLHTSSDKGTLTRNANRDALEIGFLRDLYATVKRQRQLGNMVLVPLDDLVRQLGDDDTRVRVGLSFLEQADLLRRHQDVPRTVSLRWLRSGQDTGCDRFAAAARLRLGQYVERPYAALCTQTGADPAHLEAQLLAWQDMGCLDCRPSGRDLLLALLPPPADGTERVMALLDRYTAIQAQRVREIEGYAHSRRCLHGHIANYLGGQPRQHCAACDRCLGGEILPSLSVELPDAVEQLQTVLAVLAEQSWGRRTLVWILKGDAKAGDRAQRSRYFGRLNFRSRAALRRLIDTLLRAGCIDEVTLEHGGVMLVITQQGHSALDDGAPLAALAAPPAPSAPAASAAPPSVIDDATARACYGRLATWRTEQAQAQRVPPYMIGSNATLRQIALAAPQTLDELAAVKGIGPAKLEQYGEAILAVVAGKAQEKPGSGG